MVGNRLLVPAPPLDFHTGVVLLLVLSSLLCHWLLLRLLAHLDVRRGGFPFRTGCFHLLPTHGFSLLSCSLLRLRLRLRLRGGLLCLRLLLRLCSLRLAGRRRKLLLGRLPL